MHKDQQTPLTAQEPLVVLHTSTGARASRERRPTLRKGLPACGLALHFLAAPAQSPGGFLGGLSQERLELPLRDPWTGAPAGCVQLTISLTCMGRLGCPDGGSHAAGARQVAHTGAPARRPGKAAHRGLGASDELLLSTAAGMQDPSGCAGGGTHGSSASPQERSDPPAAAAPLPASEPWQEPAAAPAAAQHPPGCEAPGPPAATVQAAEQRMASPEGHPCEVKGAVRRLCTAWVARLVALMQPAGAPGHAACAWSYAWAALFQLALSCVQLCAVVCALPDKDTDACTATQGLCQGRSVSLADCDVRVRPAAGAEGGAGRPAALRAVPAPQPALRAAAVPPAARTQATRGAPPVRAAAREAPAWAEAPARAAHCAAATVPASAAGHPAAQALGNPALQGARAVPLTGPVSTSHQHQSAAERSAKLGQPAAAEPPNSSHACSLQVRACEGLACGRAGGSAVGTGRPGCASMGLQMQQGVCMGIPCSPRGEAMAPQPVPQLRGWARIDSGPGVARTLQREGRGSAIGAAGRAACRPPAPARALRRRVQGPGWDGSQPLQRAVKSSSGLWGQVLCGGRRVTAPALVQAAPAGSADLAPGRNPSMSPGLNPRGPVSVEPLPGALVAELAAGLAELRRLRSALTGLLGSAAGASGAAEPRSPALPRLQAQLDSHAPRGARRSGHKHGCAGSERGRSPPGCTPASQRARARRAQRKGSAPPRRPAFGRAALECPGAHMAAPARPQVDSGARPASVDVEPVRRLGPVCAVPKRTPAGSACGAMGAADGDESRGVEPAAPAVREQRSRTAAVVGGAPNGYAPHYRMQACPGAGAATGDVPPHPRACNRPPTASSAQPPSEAGRPAAVPAAWAHAPAGPGGAGAGGVRAAAAAPACGTQRAPSCRSTVSDRDPAGTLKLSGGNQGSGCSAWSSPSGSQGRTLGACSGGGSIIRRRVAAAGRSASGVCGSQNGEHAGSTYAAEARHRGPGPPEQAGCAQSALLTHPAPLAEVAAEAATALSMSSAGSVDPGLAGLVCIRIGSESRRSSVRGQGADMATAAEALWTGAAGRALEQSGHGPSSHGASAGGAPAMGLVRAAAAPQSSVHAAPFTTASLQEPGGGLPKMALPRGLVGALPGAASLRAPAAPLGHLQATLQQAPGVAAGAGAAAGLQPPQLAQGHDGLVGAPPSSGARTGPQVLQLAHARIRLAGVQADCGGQPLLPQQAGPEAAASAQGSRGPGCLCSALGKSRGPAAGPEPASVLHAGAPPPLLSAVAWGSGPDPAAHPADACQKVAHWLHASADSGRTTGDPSASGCARASLPASERSGVGSASFGSSAVYGGAAHTQGVQLLLRQSLLRQSELPLHSSAAY